jgi:hypothetical protein
LWCTDSRSRCLKHRDTQPYGLACGGPVRPFVRRLFPGIRFLPHHLWQGRASEGRVSCRSECFAAKGHGGFRPCSGQPIC